MTLDEAVRILRGAGIVDPLYEARQIFRLVGNIPMSALVLGAEVDDSSDVALAVNRRSERLPLEYVIGSVDFYRERYTVGEGCLIPRDDTELLVDYAVKNLARGARFLDLCTGSGCVALSTLNNTEGTFATAADISDAALGFARENAEELSLSDRIEFIKCDVLRERIPGRYHAVLSNPPYVRAGDYAQLSPEIKHEPKIAFVGGESGVEFYERITELYRDVLEPDGFIAYEIGYDQADALRKIAEAYGMRCTVLRDLSGHDRVAVLTL